VYVEFEEEVRRVDVCRAMLAFSPADANDGEVPLRTTVVIVEPSYEEALHRARDLETHQLVAFLRSLLP
jgi:hypothetical protein